MKKRSFLFLIGILLSLLIGSFFSEPITPVYADSSTTTFYAGSGDGHVSKTNADWDVCHDATWGSGSQTNYVDFYVGSDWSTIVEVYFIHRGFLPFDTSSLPDNALIQSATLNISVYDIQTTSGTRNYALVQTSQPSVYSLTNDDFELCGAVDNPTEGADRITITSTGWKSWTLNATGIGWISKTGWTKLGIRTGWLDCDDVAPVEGVQEGYIYADSSETNAPKLTVMWQLEPTINEFQAPSTVYANEYFFLNCSINDENSIADFLNATVEMSHNVILKWINSTNTFSEYYDPNSYCMLDADNSIRTTVNSTAYKLSWKIKLYWNYTEGAISIIAMNTKVYDSEGMSGSGSQSNLFTFSRITLNLQARDSDGTNLPRQVVFKGTSGNGTSFDEDSNSIGGLSINTCYGTHTINTWWGEHLVDSSHSFSVSADKTENIVTNVKRLSDGAEYILFSINETVIPTVTYVGDTELRLPLVSSTGTKELKLDNLNWVEVGQPHRIKYGSFEKNRGSSDWDWSDNVFKVPISFSTIDITIYWTEKQPPPVGPPGPGPPGPIYVPGEPIDEEEEEEKPTIPGEPILPILPKPIEPRISADVTLVGAAIIVVAVAAGLVSKQLKKQNLAGLWQRRKQKRKKAKFPKKKRRQSSFKRKNR